MNTWRRNGLLFLALTTACAGADGQDGIDGTSAQVMVSDASVEQCPAGGSVLSIGLEGQEAEEIVLCNGTNETSVASDSIGRIEASLYCGGQLSGTSLWASQDVVVFTDGSIWAHASIRDGLLEIGGSVFYAPEQIGARRAEVLFSFDVLGEVNGGYWIVSIDPRTLDSELTYFDADASGGELAWSKPSDAKGCVVNRY